MNTPSKEAFEAWRSSPVSEWFLDHYLPSRVEAHKKEWAALINAKPPQNVSLREIHAGLSHRSSALEQVSEAEYEGIVHDLDGGGDDQE